MCKKTHFITYRIDAQTHKTCQDKFLKLADRLETTPSELNRKVTKKILSHLGIWKQIEKELVIDFKNHALGDKKHRSMLLQKPLKK